VLDAKLPTEAKGRVRQRAGVAARPRSQ
jgi:hypothetical protein